MKGKLAALWKWIFPLLFVALGVFCYNTVHGHEFLGLISFCLAGLSAAYLLLFALRGRFPKWAKMGMLVLTGILCLGILIFAVTEALILEASVGQSQRDCQYILVLGAKVNGTQPSRSLGERIRTAYEYLSAHPDAVAVLSGGKGQDEGISEAECMFRHLTAMGIPQERLWLEEKATSTWENLQFSLELIEEKTGQRPESIGLVSSEYHLFRADLFAKVWGVETVGIPAKTEWVTIRINYFLREVAGVWHYLLLGE